jgi:hypothetical protein
LWILSQRTFERCGPFSRYDLFMWGRVIVGAVIILLVIVWLAAIWLFFMDPRAFLSIWRVW